jgi:hypothetical protein
MIGLTLKDLPFIAGGTVTPGISDATDDFDSYVASDDLGGLNGGTNWDAAYASRGTDEPPTDDFDGYTAGQDLNDGLNGGISWAAAYVSRDWPMPTDDMQSYSATDDLDGLNGGDDWNGAYASR